MPQGQNEFRAQEPNSELRLSSVYERSRGRDVRSLRSKGLKRLSLDSSDGTNGTVNNGIMRCLFEDQGVLKLSLV
jgi:hypothetical protein